MNRLPNLSDNKGISVTTLIKGREKYILLYDDAHRSDALRQLGRWASCRGLSFNWYDCARMSKDIREGMRGTK